MKRSARFESFILEKRTFLKKELRLCERATQRILCYSNNFLHKKLKTEQVTRWYEKKSPFWMKSTLDWNTDESCGFAKKKLKNKNKRTKQNNNKSKKNKQFFSFIICTLLILVSAWKPYYPAKGKSCHGPSWAFGEDCTLALLRWPLCSS